jgi:hypothetical protein
MAAPGHKLKLIGRHACAIETVSFASAAPAFQVLRFTILSPSSSAIWVNVGDADKGHQQPEAILIDGCP